MTLTTVYSSFLSSLTHILVSTWSKLPCWTFTSCLCACIRFTYLSC